MSKAKSLTTVVKSKERQEVRFYDVECGSFFLKGKQLYIKLRSSISSSMYNTQKISAPPDYGSNADFGGHELVEVVNVEVKIL